MPSLSDVAIAKQMGMKAKNYFSGQAGRQEFFVFSVLLARTGFVGSYTLLIS